MKTQYLLIALIVATVCYVVSFAVWAKPLNTEDQTEEETTLQEETQTASTTPQPTALDVQLPANLPEGLLFYPDAYLGGAEETSSSTVRTLILTLVTEDPVAEIIAWYTATLETNQWSVSEAEGVLTAQKGDLNIRIEPRTDTDNNEVSIIQRVEVIEPAADTLSI